MEFMRKQKTAICLLLIFSMMFLAGPVQTAAHAAMISPQTVIDTEKAANAKEQINTFLAREDVQKSLTAMGISPDEAKVRAASLSDSEAVAFADQMEKAPAGGSAGMLIGAALFVFVLLLITDILGFTKVFKFTRSIR